jgi:hypothetical protein
MLGNPVVADGAELVRATFLSEDDHQQRDNARDQRDRRSYPEQSALSVKHDPVRVPAASRYLFGTLVGSEVSLRDADGDRS